MAKRDTREGMSASSGWAFSRRKLDRPESYSANVLVVAVPRSVPIYPSKSDQSHERKTIPGYRLVILDRRSHPQTYNPSQACYFRHDRAYPVQQYGIACSGSLPSSTKRGHGQLNHATAVRVPLLGSTPGKKVGYRARTRFFL